MIKTILKPWGVETIVFFLVLWQEDIRLRLRTEGWHLSVPEGLEQFYYFQFGDFVNGYVFAFVIDGLADLVISAIEKKIKPDFTLVWRRQIGSALVAAAVSTLIIIAFELTSSSYTTADLQDIPAGIAGSLLFLSLRLAMLKFRYTRKSSAFSKMFL